MDKSIPVISLSNVNDCDGIIRDMSFDVLEKTVTGFVGLNGSGKTTTIKTILQFKKLSSGTIKYFGDQKFSNETRSLVGFLPERPYFYPFLTGNEFLKLHWDLHFSKSTKFELKKNYWLNRLDLKSAQSTKLKNYSKGMLQRIGIAQSLIHDPKLIIWDEPMSGLDPLGRQLIREILLEKKDEGVTIFFSSHLLQDIKELCDRIVIINKGRNFFEGPLSEFEVEGENLEQTFLTKIKS